MSRKIAIFIPAFNEERSIGSVVLLAKKYGPVTVVDDGSEDRTAELAKKAGAAVIRRKKNGGYGAALRAILAAAGKTSAAACVIMDGDGQHDADEIPKVAAPVLEGKADVGLGSRFLGGMRGAPAYRKEGVRVLNRFSAELAGGREVDFQCGFRALSPKAAKAIEIRENGYEAGMEMLSAAVRRGLVVEEVPVSIRYFEKANGGAVAQGAGLLTYAANQIAKRRPLFVFAALGSASIMVAALLGVFVVETFYSSGKLAAGSAFLTVLFGIGGLVLILIGINLHVLNRIAGRGSD